MIESGRNFDAMISEELIDEISFKHQTLEKQENILNIMSP